MTAIETVRAIMEANSISLGEMTVEECCEKLNISRSSWYKYLKCIDLQPS